MAAIEERAAQDGVELLIGIAGVQSNQYPRGRDLALQFAARGMTTIMGGFHVSLGTDGAIAQFIPDRGRRGREFLDRYGR